MANIGERRWFVIFGNGFRLQAVDCGDLGTAQKFASLRANEEIVRVCLLQFTGGDAADPYNWV